MATHQRTVDFLLDQLAAAGPVTVRKMFGEYCVYLAGKPVALVCDDKLFLKPTAGGKRLAPNHKEGLPYPGAKPYICIPPDEWDEREWLCNVVRVTASELPEPPPPKAKAAKAV